MIGAIDDNVLRALARVANSGDGRIMMEWMLKRAMSLAIQMSTQLDEVKLRMTQGQVQAFTDIHSAMKDANESLGRK